ncbi:MAG TPA: cobalamin biosynthesis protein [Actinocrinis sp.]|nr:cobalamin biosynthesis protein [Actinocrinis sp.]
MHRNSSGWLTAAGLAAGFAADAVFADPARGHPVALFGRAAQVFEERCYADRRLRGAAFTAACVGSAAGMGAVVSAGGRLGQGGSNRLGDRPKRNGPSGLSGRPEQHGLSGRRLGGALWTVAGTAAATWTVVGASSLRREAAAIGERLEAGDLAGARERLPRLCGRDPRGLSEAEIARAVIESVAENTSDAVVAPLFWGAVAGVPGLLGYRAANTLDAMVGHHSQRYERFGWASARLDDLANLAPARLTGLLTVACAPLVGGTRREAWRTLRRDGRRHPSPNAGRCEAAAAGALGVRLGGTNLYGTRTEERPQLGAGRTPQGFDIARANRLSALVSAAALGVAAVGAVALRSAGRRPAR